MRALTSLVAVLALSLGVLAAPAFAGGWAVTTFDDMPGQFVSGKEYLLGYTIRQHGQTAINVDKTEILALASSGRTLSFPGKSEGAVGHYVATVFFPASGTYSWQVTQGDFAPQDLGRVTIMAAAGTSTTDKTADKTAADKAAADKAISSDKALAADKAAAAEKAALSDKAAAAEKAVVVDKAAAAEKAALSDKAIAPAAPAAAGAPTSDPVRTALPFAAAAAAAMFIWRIVTMARAARRGHATT
jgi:hypothetical protein